MSQAHRTKQIIKNLTN